MNGGGGSLREGSSPTDGPVVIEIRAPRRVAVSAIAAVAEAWGAVWEPDEGSRLVVPVVAGIRRGWIGGRLELEEAGGGTRLVFHPEERRYALQPAAVVILLVGAIGGVAGLLWPFYPRLLGIAPLALVLALGAWFLVVSRLRTTTIGDFLAAVAEEAAAPVG